MPRSISLRESVVYTTPSGSRVHDALAGRVHDVYAGCVHDALRRWAASCARDARAVPASRAFVKASIARALLNSSAGTRLYTFGVFGPPGWMTLKTPDSS